MSANESVDEVEVARSAWRILVASGGVLTRRAIAERYGLSRGRVHALSQQRHFPEPVGEIGGEPVWLAVEVDRYRAQPPPRGRPRKSRSEGV